MSISVGDVETTGKGVGKEKEKKRDRVSSSQLITLVMMVIQGHRSIITFIRISFRMLPTFVTYSLATRSLFST